MYQVLEPRMSAVYRISCVFEYNMAPTTTVLGHTKWAVPVWDLSGE
jgi:hypothetical protein